MHALKASLLSVALAFAAAGFTAAQAHDSPSGEETVKPVARYALPDAPGKQVTLLTVNYAPGQASTPHMHANSVYAYVLAGTIESQLGNGTLKTYKTGETWYEPPGSHHLVSRNASRTEAATLLVFAVSDDTTPIKSPLPQ